MPKAYFTLLFDPELENGVREFWKDLETIGIHYQEPERYRPHVTLSGFDLPDPLACRDALHTICSRHPPLPLRLHHIGLFPELSVLFLEPRMTRPLADLQRDLIQEITHLPGISPPFPLYAADTWVPHCTLAVKLPPDALAHAIPLLQSRWRALEGHAIGIGLFIPPIKSDQIQERFRRTE